MGCKMMKMRWKKLGKLLQIDYLRDLENLPKKSHFEHVNSWNSLESGTFYYQLLFLINFVIFTKTNHDKL